MYLYSIISDIFDAYINSLLEFKDRYLEKIGSTTSIECRKFDGLTFLPTYLKYKWYIQIHDLGCFTRLVQLEHFIHKSEYFSMRHWDSNGGGTEFFHFSNEDRNSNNSSLSSTKLSEDNSLENVCYLLELNEVKFDVFTEDIFDKPPFDNVFSEYKKYENILDEERYIEKSKIILRNYQKEPIFDKFKPLVVNWKKKIENILSMATGTGKTICTFAMIGIYSSYFSNSILWFTRKKDIIKSQFDDIKKISLKCSDFIDFDKYNVLVMIDGSFDLKRIQDLLLCNKPLFLVVNTDKIMGHYNKLPTDKFGMIVLDECHSAGAKKHFEMLSYMKENWNYQVMLGLSATPYREEIKSHDNLMNIFGDGIELNFLYIYDFVRAIGEGVLSKPHFHWNDVKVIDEVSKTHSSKMKSFEQKEVSFKNVLLSSEDKLFILNEINDLFTISTYKVALFWTNTTLSADNWVKFINNNKNNYEQLNNVKIYCSHSNNDQDLNTIKEFLNEDPPVILIVVDRAREGFDDERICLLSSLDPVKNHQSNTFIQMLGRGSRKTKGKEEFHFLDTFILESGESYEDAVAEKMFKLQEALMREHSPDNVYFEENKNKSYSLRTEKGDIILTTSIKDSIKKTSTWENINKRLRDKMIEVSKSITYLQAKKIIKRSPLKIKDRNQYLELVQKLPVLPQDPIIYFNTKWKGWNNYFNLDTSSYYSKDEFESKIEEYRNTLSSLWEEYVNNSYKLYIKIRANDDRLPLDPIGLYGYSSYDEFLYNYDSDDEY